MPSDQARLGRYVEIKPGQPLDPELVRHVVELFYATGEYADVVVETTPVAGGVEVVFRPVKAPLLTEVRVEGDRLMKAEALRRTARLRAREPLWPARLEQAARDVALGLAQRGYLEARVSESIRPTAGGADAVFTITAGPRVRVGSARVEGPPAVMATLEPDIRPHVGEPFRREQTQAAAQHMRADLVRLGYWRAVVTVAEAYDPGAGMMGLVSRSTRVRAWTSRCAGSTRPIFKGRIRDLLKEGELKSDAVEEASDLLEEDARRQGYRLAHVSHHEEQRGPRLVPRLRRGSGAARLRRLRARGGRGTEGLETALKTRPAGAASSTRRWRRTRAR